MDNSKINKLSKKYEREIVKTSYKFLESFARDNISKEYINKELGEYKITFRDTGNQFKIINNHGIFIDYSAYFERPIKNMEIFKDRPLIKEFYNFNEKLNISIEDSGKDTKTKLHLYGNIWDIEGTSEKIRSIEDKLKSFSNKR